MEMQQIYKLVQPELDALKAEFNNIISIQSGFPEMQSMLEQVLVSGKGVRPLLTLLSGMFYDYDVSRLLPMATAAETMHIATLVHDDAIDSADLRRGRSTINSIWGVDLSILLGDFLFACAGEYTSRTGSMRAVELFTQTLGIIARGEIKQAFSSFKIKQTYDQYLERIAGKTAALFNMSTESGAALSNAPESSVQILKNYGYNLGLAFQVVDDILDFVSTEADMGKPVGADLRQGTITLPSLKLLERYPHDNPIEKIFNQEDVEVNLKLAIDMVRNSAIIDECYQMASDYATMATRELAGLPNKPAREALAALADYIIKRQQ
jgi:geranylgeranyl pyrophosphate synthase